MDHSTKKFYVTTPIYYVTAKPHLGSLYSTLIADVLARWHILQGIKTFFLTGTDEHGQKIAQAAQAAGKKPKEFVDSFIESYKSLWKKYNINYSYFIRTTDSFHVAAVQSWLKQLITQGDIYKAFYSGWYCTPCETFVIEESSAIKEPLCSSCNRQTAYVSEECYFFRLSAYQEKLLKFYENNPDFITPKERLQEVISFVKSGLKDLSISRTTITWGIPFPDDAHHVTYVWADALNNYITAVGYGQPHKQEEFAFWWPADVHVMGKDIIRFHAIYWPAFLMASGLALPKKLLVHGWIKVNDQKMSKSLGNVVDPEMLAEKYSVDTVRYYLMRYLAITHDSSFNIGDLERANDSDLANDLGNLLNRMIALAIKNNVTQLDAPEIWSEQALNLREKSWNMLEEYSNYFYDGMFHQALASLWKFVNEVNSYFHNNEPWKLAKNDPKKFVEILSATCHSLYTIGMLAWPIMPEHMQQLFTNLGISFELNTHNYVESLRTNRWDKRFILMTTKPLFEKIEKINANEELDKKSPETPFVDDVSIEEFTKIYLLAGTITHCEPVQKSEKLYKLQVSFGQYGIRQIISGVKAFFKPEDLKDQQAIFIYNLKPRMMLGLESHGMLLVAQGENNARYLVKPSNPVTDGTRLQ